MGKRSIFQSEEGFSTLGMAVALLVTLSLLFSAAQVYRVSSASAAIQEVADAAALAAENEVAEFMVAVRVCDAVVLTLSMTGVVVCAVGVVALCVPPLAELAAKLIELGGKVLDARDSFAERAASGLNELQRALPFLAAAKASAAGSANSTPSSGGAVFCSAMLVPSQGEEISLGSLEEASDLLDSVEQDGDAVKDAAERAEEAAREADEAKRRGWESDCGNNPAYCMYERAASLAQLSGSANPLYNSPDAWSFSVALKRAQAYYAVRAGSEAIEGSSVEEQADAALRRVFYAYAKEELSHGYVHESEDSFDAFFPIMPHNTDEMRSTRLYTDVRYPISQDDAGERTMHAWSGCPEAANVVGLGSISQMDGDDSGFAICPQCEFRPASMGKVAAASTSIANGFEHHYNAVAQAAADYQVARAKLDPAMREAKELTQDIFEDVLDAIRAAGNKRIEASPPGAKGAIAFAVGTEQQAASSGFESPFVADAGSLGTRVAVSASTLLAEKSDEGKTVVSSILDGLGQDGGAATGAARVVLDAWSALLGVYANGQQALTEALAKALDAIPLVGSSGLGGWAAGKLESLVDAAGLAPAKLEALKPVLVNSAAVAKAGQGEAFSARYLAVKQKALSYSSSSTDVFSSVVGDLEQGALDALGGSDGVVEIAEIELPIGGMSIPVTIVLPDAVQQGARGLVQQAAAYLRSAFASFTGLRVWQ